MKLNIVFILCIVSISCSDIKTNRDNGNIPINDYKMLMSYFQNPPSEYSTAPFWVWNDEITKEKIDTQLESFKNQGISSLIVHCRPGLITEYLSDEWFELNRYALEQAKGMDMKLWLYDENGFPSGFGGGHVYREMPESYNQPQGLALQKVRTLDKTKISDSTLVLMKQGEIFTNITNNVDDYHQKPGEYYVFEKTYGPSKGRWTGYPYPDLLIPGVTEKFIEITMNGYEKTFGNEFGDNIPGIFTDEPHVQPPSKASIRYTPGFFKTFEERWGYTLPDKLPLLYEESGNYRKVRHDYYQLLIELFVERWSKPWHNYTEAHNLKWTGHYWEHGWPNPRHASDHMILYAYHQVPGIDMLFNDEQGRPDQFGNIMAARELLSIANQFGRHRTLSETYGASGWDLDFEAMKRLGDWEMAGGVNLMNQHLAYMTTKGARKRDFPQSISWHASWWPQYHYLANHHARLSVAMSSGQNLNNILVINPTTTMWMYFSPQQDKDYLGASGLTNAYANDFKNFINLLEEHMIEYDIGSEMVIGEFGEVKKDQFVIQQRSYEKLILGPHVENLNDKTFELLESFLAGGGTVYYTELPAYINANESDKLKILAQKYDTQWIKLKLEKDFLKEEFFNPDFELITTTDPKDLIHQRRTLSDGQLIMMTNFNKSKINEVEFTASGNAISLLKTFTGESEAFPAKTMENNKITVSLRLHPGESKLLYFHENQVNQNPPSDKELQFDVPLPGSELRAERDHTNMLVLDYCDVKVAGRSFKEINYLHAADSIFKLHGFPVSDIDHNPWNFSVQYRTETLDKNKTFGEGSGFQAVFPFQVDNSYDLKPIKIGIEYGRLYNVSLNGQEMTIDPDVSYFDHSLDFYTAESSMLQKGLNQIKLTIQPMHVHAELERIILLGDFDVFPVNKGFVIKNPGTPHLGNWVNQGMPFYSETVSYSKTFQLDDKTRAAKVVLNEWHGSVAVVNVNGNEAGIIGWKPYELIIHDHLISGSNQIDVTIYGTPRNLMGPHYFDPPKGIATPWSWNNAPPGQPPGSEYSFVPYGLMEEFSLFITNK